MEYRANIIEMRLWGCRVLTSVSRMTRPSRASDVVRCVHVSIIDKFESFASEFRPLTLHLSLGTEPTV